MNCKIPQSGRHNYQTATLVACVMVFVSALAIANSSLAQRIQRIAATVNDDIVSEYDLRARMQVVIVSSGLRPTPQLQKRVAQQVLRGLIDEQLQLQEAKRRNISVSNSDMRRRIASLEKQNKIAPGTLDEHLRKIGIPPDALKDQVRAQISWQKLVGRVLLPRVTVGEDEIDEILERLKERKGQIEYRVSEILLTVDQQQNEDEVRQTADRLLEELRKGANFSAIARQFSQTASASVGGDLGWIQEETMNSELRQIIAGMKEGETVGPVRTLAGIQIFRLADKRRILTGSVDDTVLELQQILLPFRKDTQEDEIKAQVDLAQTLSDTLSNCEDHLRAAAEAKSQGSAKLGKIRLGNLSGQIRQAVEKLPVGKPSTPVKTENGVAIFMVCSRKEPESGLPTREEITNRLREERVGVLARRFLRDLRAAAIVDLRV